jgi:hypothetical protein
VCRRSLQIYSFATQCSEFMGLLSELLRGGAGDASLVDGDALLERLVSLLRSHPVVELSVGDDDLVLRGLLGVTAALLHARPDLKEFAGSPKGHNLVHEVCVLRVIGALLLLVGTVALCGLAVLCMPRHPALCVSSRVW